MPIKLLATFSSSLLSSESALKENDMGWSLSDCRFTTYLSTDGCVDENRKTFLNVCIALEWQSVEIIPK